MASYTEINAHTMANITSESTVSGAEKEQRWVLKAHVESLDSNPLTALIGGWKGGKPIIEVADTKNLAGNTVYLHRLAPLAGPGRQGESSRDGQEEKQRYSNYSFTIGRMWHGTGQTTVARDQTVIGSNFDRTANKQLGEWLGWIKGMNLEYSMIAAAVTKNTVRPNNKATRELLRSADYVEGSTIVRAGNVLAGLGGKSLKMAKSKAGQVIPGYLLVSTQYGLERFKATANYTNIMANAQGRGDSNELFAGGLPNWNGHGLWEWTVSDHTGYGPVGSAGVPRAFLGVAVTSGTATFDITGGGDAAGGALTTPLYFQHFSNAGFTGFEGVKVASSTATTRYVGIMNMSGADAGKVGFYSYTTNNGNKLVVAGRLGSAASGIRATTLGNITYDTAPWVAAGSGSFAGLTEEHPEGSLIFEVNSYGVPIGRSYMMADEAIVSGYGSIDGKVGLGNRTEAKSPHGLNYAVGLEAAWGCRCVPRVDGVPQGFILIEHSIPVPGLPDVV